MSLNLKHYSALAAALLASKSETDAQILYKNLGDIELSTEVFTLDLNNDNIPDFEVRAEDHVSSNTYCGNDQTYIGHRLINFAYNQEMGSGGKLYKLKCGDLISSAAQWSSKSPLVDQFNRGWYFSEGKCSLAYFTSFTVGNWNVGQEGYAGLKFRIGTETHYGWIRVFLNSAHHIVIEDCAYEATAGKAIAAGALPCEKPALASEVKGCSEQGANVTVSNYSPCLNYQWFFNGRNMGAFNDSLRIDSSGNILVVSNDGNNCVDTSNVSVVTIQPNPVPKITELNDTLISSISSKYQWYEHNYSISGATNQKYVPQYNSYSYQVEVTDSNGCFSYSSPDTFASCNLIHNLYQPLLYDYDTIPHDTIPMCNLSLSYIAGWITAVYEGDYHYQWFKNDTALFNEISWFLTVTDTGQYYCRLTGYGIICNSDTITVVSTDNHSPKKPTITRIADSLESSHAHAYQWFNDLRIPGATDRSYTPPGNDDYTVEAIDSEGCGTFSDSYPFASCSLINPELNFSDTVVTCAGNIIKLTLSDLPTPTSYYYTYDWIVNGNNIAYTVSNYYDAISSGLYYCNVEVPDTTHGSTLCASNSVYLLFIDIPHITLNRDTLVSSSSKYNQWVKDGEIIPGANGQFYAPASTGSYAVIVSPTDTCSMMSDYVSYSITSVQNNLNQKAPMISYINSKLLQVQFPNSDFLQGKIKIINALGQPLREIVIDKNVMQIPFTEIESGWFVLDMEKDEHRFFSPVVIF